jgi:hypothetical protein
MSEFSVLVVIFYLFAGLCQNTRAQHFFDRPGVGGLMGGICGDFSARIGG